MKGAPMLAAMTMGAMMIFLAGCSDPASKLTSSNPDEVIAAIRAIAQRGHEGDVGLLVDVTANPDELIAKEAARGIGGIDRPEAADALRSIAKGERNETRETIRAEAVLQLNRHPDEKTAELLRKIVEVDPGPTVRTAAVAGLETLAVSYRGRDNMAVHKDLARLVKVAQDDGDVAVQSRAVKAIESLVNLKFKFDGTKSGAERQAVIDRIAEVVLPMTRHEMVHPDEKIEAKKKGS
jgi:hypothetical protein